MYQNFIGIDIGKYEFHVATYEDGQVSVYTNDSEGFTQLVRDYRDTLSNGLVVLETTGGYEKACIRFLQQHDYAVHRANTRKVKHFIRSFGKLGKSDSIDSKALAHYGAERHKELLLYTENKGERLLKLVGRRNDLKKLLVQEKNRLKAPDQAELWDSYKKIIKAVTEEIEAVDAEIELIYQKDPQLSLKKEVLKTVVGIGDIIATELLALLPELGTVNRKQIASLAGVAPHPNESGKWVGHRFVRGGRTIVKPTLFMAALTASRSKGDLGKFYANLTANGKKKMVAITALMRKIVVIANARMRDFYMENPRFET